MGFQLMMPRIVCENVNASEDMHSLFSIKFLVFSVWICNIATNTAFGESNVASVLDYEGCYLNFVYYRFTRDNKEHLTERVTIT